MAQPGKNIFADPALISRVELENEETSMTIVEDMRNLMFEAHRERIHLLFNRSGSCASPKVLRQSAVREPTEEYWKKGKEFNPGNLFFRSVDTARLLPMALADFRIQWYFTRGFGEWLDGHKKEYNPKPRVKWQQMSLLEMLFEVLVLRNMHDYGGGDIPVIITNWSEPMLDQAFAHWVEVSKGELSEEEVYKRTSEISVHFQMHNPGPCFEQADLTVRALLSDPAVEYVPRFIIFKPFKTKQKARALFSHPTFQPPPALTETYPKGCGGTTCKEEDGAFDFSACRALADDSSMVRKDKFPFRTIRCNVWTCTVEEELGSTTPCPFQKCQKCKEALYCCRDHQLRDWKNHKLVCEGFP